MNQYETLIRAAEKKYGIPQGLLVAQMRQESAGNPNAKSRTGALGLMQLMPGTAKDLGVDPLVPEQAIDGAARYMKGLLADAGGDSTKALTYYVGGKDPKRYGKETHAYPAAVGSKMDPDDVFEGVAGSAPSDPDEAFDHVAGAHADEVNPARTSPDAVIAELTGEAPKKRGQPVKQDDYQKGMNEVLAKKDVTSDDILRYMRSSGYEPTPDFDKQAAAAIKAHSATAKIGAPVEQTTFGNLLQGAIQGGRDVGASLDEFGNWVDSKVPFLNKIDQLAGNVVPAVDPAHTQGRIDDYNINRNAFNRTFGNGLSGNIGRVGGNILVGGALMAPVAGVALPAEALGGSLLARGGVAAVNGAAQGVAASALTSASSDAPLTHQLQTGGEVGAVLGPAGKVAGAGFNALKNAVAPRIDPAIAELAQKAADMGIDVRGSQISASPAIRTADSILARVPGSGIAADNDAQKAAFTRAVGQTFGADSHSLTPDVMNAAKGKISQIYDDVSSRTHLNVNPESGSQFIDNLGSIASTAKGVLDTSKIPALDHLIDNVMTKIGPDGTISGDAFKALTSKGSMLDQATRDGNSSFANTAKAVKAELNGALEASALPEDVAALKKADWQWKNMRTVEKLLANSPDGKISPALLQNKVTTSFGNRAYTGAGDLGDLGNIGQRFLKDQGSSNTAERSHTLNFLLNAAKVGGGAGAALLGLKAGISPEEVMAAVGTGTAALTTGKVAGNMLRSDAYRNRLINSALNRGDPAAVSPLGKYYLPPAVLAANPLLQATTPPQHKR